MISVFKKYYIALPKKEERIANLIIDNELTEIEKQATEKYLFKNMTQEQIATELKKDQSCITRAIGRAEKKINDYMKYIQIYKMLKE